MALLDGKVAAEALAQSRAHVDALVARRDSLIAKASFYIKAEIDQQIEFQRRVLTNSDWPEDAIPVAPDPKYLDSEVVIAPDYTVEGKEFSTGTLRARIFRYLAVVGDGKTVAEIAAGIGEREAHRVATCLRDARQKDRLLEAPTMKRWTRTKRGRQFSANLCEEMLVWVSPGMQEATTDK